MKILFFLGIRIGFLGAFLSGCNLATRLSNVGDPPEMSQIQNPTLVSEYQPISMPMPRPEPTSNRMNSLWQTGARAFFKDQRASQVGDIVTVIVDLKDNSTQNWSNTTKKQYTRNDAVSNFFKFKNNGAQTPSLINTSTNTNLTGAVNNSRKEAMDVKIGATILQILPNGNLVIQGRQEVLFQSELRLIEIKGIVRREDIAMDNSILHTKIAEARIVYGGRGDATDANSVPWGQQIMNKVLPW